MAPQDAAVRAIPTLTLSAARKAAAAAETHARTLGIPMNIAVVDSSCQLLHFIRMDGAKLTSITTAIDKAFTAAGHRVGTHVYKEMVWPGGAAYGLNNTNGGRFTTIAGGLPILDASGNVLGAIGVSAGKPSEDAECASKGVEVLEPLVKGKEKARL